MTTIQNPTNIAADDQFEALAASLGIDRAELERRLATPARPAPTTVAVHVADYLAPLGKATRDTYATHLLRMVRGVGPVCDQKCEPCLLRSLTRRHIDGSMVEDYICTCTCGECRRSHIVIPPLGDRIVGPDVYTRNLVENLATVARRYAIKSGIIDNRGRAARGLPSKKADGHNAAETSIAAFRSLFATALEHLDNENPASKVPKPRRDTKERRPMQPFELAELHLLTASGGNDPELDLLVLDTGIATGARAIGIKLMTVGKLHASTQLIGVIDKGRRVVDMPVSAELIARLLAHAKERGGAVCDPSSVHYRPDSPVFYAKNGKPMSERRLDSIAERWQTNLDWARNEGVSFHYIRHTIAAYLAQVGPQYKKRYLRHADNTVTDIYGKCPMDEFAGVMADLLGFEHPLVHGIDDRRAASMRRMGLIPPE